MYDSTKPNSGITFSAGRVVVQNNFAGIESYISRDHVSYDANSADSGKHKAIRLTEQTAPTTLVNELGLYAKDTGSEPDLYIRRESSGTEIRLTTGEVQAGTDGYSFLPGGLIIQWGRLNNVSKGGTALTFPKAFPNNCYNISTNCIDAFYVAIVNTFSKTGANIKQGDGGSSHDVFWIAIGD